MIFFFSLDAFSWEEYLKETSSIPAPASCFRQVCHSGFMRCLVFTCGQMLKDNIKLKFTF